MPRHRNPVPIPEPQGSDARWEMQLEQHLVEHILGMSPEGSEIFSSYCYQSKSLRLLGWEPSPTSELGTLTIEFLVRFCEFTGDSFSTTYLQGNSQIPTRDGGLLLEGLNFVDSLFGAAEPVAAEKS